MTDIHGNYVHYVYNNNPGSAKELIQVNDNVGHSFTLAYANGQLTTVTDQSGRSVSYQYSPAGDLITYIDPAGHAWQYGYDTDHRLLTKTNP